MIQNALIFLLVCLAAAFVCSAIKEDEDSHLTQATFKLFGVMAGGIVAFGAVVQALTSAASS